ncbi:hypothetical protein LR48_Vigan125s000500 [Vigna angularis]|uniref:Uncharacterized protein n=1 Tax=Phaseolus angularis TaxID=3914 RepID=A0A0L9T4T6_PHAAN|nr:hypothetical protein LR48_Vigan125s000500 [Vigna angularis]
MVVEDQPLIRKRKGGEVIEEPTSSKKMKEVEEPSDRPIPGGVWDPAFNLGHKIAFNLDEPKKKVVEKIIEQQMDDTSLEFTSREAMATWHLAYASDRGVLRVELQKVQTQVKEAKAGLELKKARDQLVADLEQGKKEVFDQKSASTALRVERDALLLTTVEDKKLKEEMGEAIVLEHTRGFKKALRQVSHLFNISTEGVDFEPRKDVYRGCLVPLSEILEGALVGNLNEAEEEVVAETTVVGEVREEDPAVPSTNVDDVVHMQ